MLAVSSCSNRNKTLKPTKVQKDGKRKELSQFAQVSGLRAHRCRRCVAVQHHADVLSLVLVSFCSTLLRR